MSLPVRGAWIEIGLWLYSISVLKRSLPVRGAWIEIIFLQEMNVSHLSLPVRGAWIEIQSIRAQRAEHVGRSPCGERGLKFAYGRRR